MSLKVLVVDDDPNVCEVLRLYLEKQDAEVITMASGTQSCEYFKNNGADLIILDLKLPDSDGFDICKEIRKDNTVPIIMLTARATEYDRIKGLDLGADDYITKPFSPIELMSRINSLFRRIQFEQGDNDSKTATQKLNFPGLSINQDSRSISVNGKNIKLTVKEFELLWLLAGKEGKVLSRATILNKIWGYDSYIKDRTIDVHIKWLREKLKCNNNRYKYLHTVHGTGYKFEVRQ